MDNVFDYDRSKPGESVRSTVRETDCPSAEDQPHQKRRRGALRGPDDSNKAPNHEESLRPGEGSWIEKDQTNQHSHSTNAGLDRDTQAQLSQANTPRPRSAVRVEGLLNAPTPTQSQQAFTSSTSIPAILRTPDPAAAEPRIIHQDGSSRPSPRPAGTHASPDDQEKQSIKSLEEKLGRLQSYTDAFRLIAIMDSEIDKVRRLQEQLKTAREEKAQLVFSRIRSDFPHLQDSAMEEVQRLRETGNF